MTALQLLRIGAELAIDLVREALRDRKSEAPVPPVGLPYRDVEIQLRAGRNAGHEGQCQLSLPTGQRCVLASGHAGRCRFTPRK